MLLMPTQHLAQQVRSVPAFLTRSAPQLIGLFKRLCDTNALNKFEDPLAVVHVEVSQRGIHVPKGVLSMLDQ